MNIELFKKNLKWTIITTAFGAISTLLLRKVFIVSLPDEYLGLLNVVANILIIASFFDFEIETYCNYRILKAFAENKDINKTVSLVDKLLKRAGYAVLIAGIIFSPLLMVFLKGEWDWGLVYAVYMAQLLSTCMPYFNYSYRLVERATETEYVAMIVTTAGTFIENIIKVIILLKTKNLILYAITEPIASDLIKKVNRYFVKRKFKNIRVDYSLEVDEKEKKDIEHNIRTLLPTKLGYTIGATGEDLITAYTNGIMSLSYITNYKFLYGCVNSFLDRLYSYAKGAVGKFAINQENENYDGFKTLSMLIYMLASLLFCMAGIGFSDFINLYFGEKYVINIVPVILLAIFNFIDWTTMPINMYRDAKMDYKLDGKWLLMGSTANIIISITLSFKLGISGIIVGSIISLIIKRYGKLLVVFKNKENMKIKTLINWMVQILMGLAQLIACYTVTRLIPLTWIGLITKMIIVLLVSIVFNTLLLNKTSEYKRIKKLLVKNEN